MYTYMKMVIYHCTLIFLVWDSRHEHAASRTRSGHPGRIGTSCGAPAIVDAIWNSFETVPLRGVRCLFHPTGLRSNIVPFSKFSDARTWFVFGPWG